MNLLILGTSSSIMRNGYVSHVQHNLDCTISNLSIGGATSSAGSYFSDDYTQLRYDFAILDYQVNDHLAYQNGIFSDGETERNLRYIITQLRLHGCVPIVLILPSISNLSTPSNVEAIQLKVCKELSVHVLNTRRLIADAIARKTSLWDLMQDEFHISEAAGCVVGQAIAEAIKRLSISPRTALQRHDEIFEARRIKAEEFTPLPPFLTRKSSLVEARFAVFHKSDYAVLPIADSEALFAIMINTGAPGAKIRLSNKKNDIIKNVVMFWDRSNISAFYLYLMDFSQKIRGGLNGVTIEMMESTVPVTETNLHPRETLIDRYGEVEIAGALVKNREPRVIRYFYDAFKKETLNLNQFLGHKTLLQKFVSAKDILHNFWANKQASQYQAINNSLRPFQFGKDTPLIFSPEGAGHTTLKAGWKIALSGYAWANAPQASIGLPESSAWKNYDTVKIEGIFYAPFNEIFDGKSRIMVSANNRNVVDKIHPNLGKADNFYSYFWFKLSDVIKASAINGELVLNLSIGSPTRDMDLGSDIMRFRPLRLWVY